VLAAQDAPPGLGEIDCSYSTIVGRCPAMPTVRNGSNSDTSICSHRVRSSPNTGPWQSEVARQFRARCGREGLKVSPFCATVGELLSRSAADEDDSLRAFGN
jgi:hypothetical protein